MQTSQNADQPTTAPAGATSTPAPAGKGGAPRSAALRDAFLARGAARPFDKGDAAPPAAKPAPDAEVDDAADLMEGTPPAAPEEAAAAKEAPAPVDEVKLDPEATKRLAESQRRDREWKAKVAADRKAVDDARAAGEKALADAKAAHEQEWAPKIAAHKETEAKLARIRHDPIGALRAAGFTDEDFAALSHMTWAETPKGKADPKLRETAAQMQRERERNGTVDTRLTAAEERAKAAEDKAAAIEKQMQEREQAARAEAEASQYLDAVQRAVTPDAPHVHRWVQKSPAAAREAFRAIAIELYQADRIEPSHAEVVAEVERRMRADLELRGYDPDAVLVPPTQKKPAATPPAKTLTPGGAGATTPKPKLTKEQMREEFIRRAPPR